MMLTSDLPADDPLPGLAAHFIDELAVMGRICHLSPNAQRRRNLIDEYCARREIPARTLVGFLEQQCGMKFADARLPYRHNSATWPPAQPLAGYTDDAPKPSPGQWLGSVFSTWQATTGSDDSGVEARWTIRPALWVCHQAGLVASLRYVLDLVDAGQVLDPRGAAWAASRLTIGSDDASDPWKLVSSLVEGGTPPSRQEWLFLVPDMDRWHASGRPFPVPACALESLIVHGWALVERARAAVSLDDWLPAALALQGTLAFINDVIALTFDAVPVEVAAILSQFEELAADVNVAVVCMEIAERTGTVGISDFIEYERDLERKFRKRGDDTGRRFQQERLLLPRPVIASEGGEEWARPGWRLGIPWMVMQGITDPCPRVPELAAAFRHFKNNNTAAARTALDDVLRRYPCHDAAHWLRAKTFQADGNHRTALESAIPVVVLRPEHYEGWELLGRSLDALGHRRSAAVTLRMVEFSMRRATNRDEPTT